MSVARSAGRFTEPSADAFRLLNDSIGYDWRLAPYDVDQSVAHAAMLAQRGIITAEDCEALHRGLEQVRAELADGSFPFDASDGEREWGSIGVSENVIESSWEALVDSLQYGMELSRAPRREAAPDSSVGLPDRP